MTCIVRRCVLFGVFCAVVGGGSQGVAKAVWEPSGVLTNRLITGDHQEGVEANRESRSVSQSFSGNGRFVAFESVADNLVAGDTNSQIDIFVRDLQSGTTERVSVDSAGKEQNEDDAIGPSISTDGRFVTFSTMNSYDPRDTNNQPDVYVRDRQLKTTTLVSTNSAGEPSKTPSYSDGADISGNGQFVSFTSSSPNLVSGDVNNKADTFRKNLSSGKIELISVDSSGNQANLESTRTRQFSTAISSDGRFVVFESIASNLVTGDRNNKIDVFVRDVSLGTTERVSVDSSGNEQNDDSRQPGISISDDGQVVTFSSEASNLVPSDTNNTADVFVHNRISGVTERVSQTFAGREANGSSDAPFMSPDGHFIVYYSSADNLVPGDTNNAEDTFLHDLRLKRTERVSLNSAGIQGNQESKAGVISNDGQFVMFTSNANNLVSGDSNARDDIFVRNLTKKRTERVSIGDDNRLTANGHSYAPSVSFNGQFVAFYTFSGNLLPDDGTAGAPADVGMRDRFTGQFKIASTDSSGRRANRGSYDPVVAIDGSRVVFYSSADNLVNTDKNEVNDVFMKDFLTGKTERISVRASGREVNGGSFEPDLAENGQFVVFTSHATDLVDGDTNGKKDVFRKDLNTGKVDRVSVSSTGVEANNASGAPSISGDGRYVAFESPASNLVGGDKNNAWDIFVKDMQTGSITRISTSGNLEGNDDSRSPDISSDGKTVVFASNASQLVKDDTNGAADVFVKNLTTGELKRGSTLLDGSEANHGSIAPSVSGDGRYVTFDSLASNFDVNDKNNADDVYVKDMNTGFIRRVSVNNNAEEGDKKSLHPAISHDGRTIAFESDATNFIPVDINGFTNIFAADWKDSPAPLVP